MQIRAAYTSAGYRRSIGIGIGLWDRDRAIEDRAEAERESKVTCS
jgi:hypothetical protein